MELIHKFGKLVRYRIYMYICIHPHRVFLYTSNDQQKYVAFTTATENTGINLKM